MTTRILAMALILLGSFAAPAWAQHEASEASGRVLDNDGNPIQGAVITFSPKSSPHLVYSGKTNKKGRFFIAGMYTPQADDFWQVKVEAEGLLPSNVRIESRTVNRVLIGDIMDLKLRAGSVIAQFPIPRMGAAKVDFTMAPEDELESASAVKPETEEGEGTGTASAEAVPVAKDPWVEALNLFNAGDLVGSLAPLREAIEEEPEDVERQETHAKVLYQLGRFDQALTATEGVLALAPDRFQTHMLMGTIHIKLGAMEPALASLDRAAELAPRDVSVHRQRAYVGSQLGQIETEISAYQAISEIEPDNAEAWVALGNAYANSGREAESQAAFEKVVEIDPENAYQTYYNLGSLIMNRNDRTDADTKRAVDAFRKATEIKKDYAPAYKQLAFALLGTGDKPGAKKALEDFLVVKPKGGDADQVRALLKTF